LSVFYLGTRIQLSSTHKAPEEYAACTNNLDEVESCIVITVPIKEIESFPMVCLDPEMNNLAPSPTFPPKQ
jgi:hypothetical protein